MSVPPTVPPCAASALAWARNAANGPGYWAARRIAFDRSDGICQFCGLYPAEEAHHWAFRYPADSDITADDLTALCRSCHWIATLRRVTGRARAGVWFVLAVGRSAVRARKCVSRVHPRHCRSPHRLAPSRSVVSPVEPDLRALEERCHLVLVIGCLACDRYVRLAAVAALRRCPRSMSVNELRRRLLCCRCRSRTRWVLLGGWPQGVTGSSVRNFAPRNGGGR